MNDAPVFTSQGTIDGAVEDTAFTLTYEALLAAATAADVSNTVVRTFTVTVTR